MADDLKPAAANVAGLADFEAELIVRHWGDRACILQVAMIVLQQVIATVAGDPID